GSEDGDVAQSAAGVEVDSLAAAVFGDAFAIDVGCESADSGGEFGMLDRVGVGVCSQEGGGSFREGFVGESKDDPVLDQAAQGRVGEVGFAVVAAGDDGGGGLAAVPNE